MTKKILLIVIGGVLLLCGLVAIIPGAILARVGGGVSTGYHTVGTATPALVSPTEKVSDNANTNAGSTTITVKARDASEPVFLGVARTTDVDNYLNGVAYDEVRDFEVKPFQVRTSRHDGLPFAEPPTSQSFWVASAEGTNPTLDWKVSGGDYRLVIMNADGSPGAATQTQVGLQSAALRNGGIATLVTSSVIALVGLGLLIWGIVTVSTRTAQPAMSAGPSYPSSGPPSGQASYGQPPSGPSSYEPPPGPPSGTSSYEPPSGQPPPPPPPPPPPSA